MNARMPLLAVALLQAGCTGSFSYSYETFVPKLAPGNGRPVAFAIVDERPDVLSGAQSPARVGSDESFVPVPLETTSGHALADDFSEALEHGLDKAGFKPEVVHVKAGETADAARGRLAATHAARQVLIEVQQWLILYNEFSGTLKQHYKVRLGVLDAGGKELTAQQFDKDVTEPRSESSEESLFERLCEGVLDSPAFSKVLRGT
jgi:hypothetical protein